MNPPTAPAGSPMVTRFAPSPTGHLHVGGARSALFCWALARQMGGRFMIRIEDTDAARSSDESARGILEDLAWLGIDWDDGPVLEYQGRRIGGGSRPVGPFFQAQRLDLYNGYIEHLVKLGRAYPAFETSEQLDADRRAASAKKATYKYPRPADVQLGVFNAERWQRAVGGEAHVVRFVMPDGEIRVEDQVLGTVKFARGEVDDFVIRKMDGFPTYHFAVVIDDELMGTTHVLRAQEHLINTPRHVAMQRALTRLDTGAGFTTPVYAHMPLIFNPDGSKMSKRDKAKAARKALKDALSKDPALRLETIAGATGFDEASLSQFEAGENDRLDIAQSLAAHFRVALPEIEVWDYRAAGYLPEAIVNFLALLGWSTGMKQPDGKDVERFDAAFLAQHFSIDRIGKTPAKFDRVKLLSFNGEYLSKLAPADFESRLLVWADRYDTAFAAQIRAHEPARRAALLGMAQPRCKTFADAPRVLDFALVRDDAVRFDPGAMDKQVKSPAGGKVLADLRELLEMLPEFAPEAIEQAISGYATAKGLKLGEVAQPLRVGVTGTTVSPPLGQTLFVLGKPSTLARIDRCLEHARPA